MPTSIDEAELARLEALAKDATPTPWMGTIDPSHFYTFSTILGGEKKQSRGLNHQLIVQVGGWATVREQQSNTRYISAACNNVPALIAEVRRLREKVEAWEWFGECRSLIVWRGPEDEMMEIFNAAREAVHADRE